MTAAFLCRILRIRRSVVFRDRLIFETLLLASFLVFFAWQSAGAENVKEVPLWDGETNANPADTLLNRYGGPVVHDEDGNNGTITVSRVTDVFHSGNGAYQAKINDVISEWASFQLALSGFYEDYVMSRNILRFETLCFWLKNDTGVAFKLKLEIKDYNDSNAHRRYRYYEIPAGSSWMQVCAPVRDVTGWEVDGNPDLSQARFIGFVFEAKDGLPLTGSVYFDDVVLIEPGDPMDPETASLNTLVNQLARRQFDGLWGSRSRKHGMIPMNSCYANIGALNSTAAVVKLLPTARQQTWITQEEADSYIEILVTTLNTLMDSATYLPPRYVDWVSLKADKEGEESPIDAALLALALYQYRSLSSTPSQLQSRIDGLLDRFNFAAFGSPQGWKLAYKYDSSDFTDGTYDGYSGEIWIISLAAHLMSANRVDITQYYNTGVYRKKDYLAVQSLTHVVHSYIEFRAPFLQWLFPLFVVLDALPKDSYPDPELATNPLQNAIRYQKDCHLKLEQQGRALFIQPDAGDDGSGSAYKQYSCYEDFDRPNLFMPWSVSFSLLAEASFAESALRNHLAHRLHGPFGLNDSVHWIVGESAPYQITARDDFWNVSLSTMAMTLFLFQDNEFLTSLPEVSAALERVFSCPDCSKGTVTNTTFKAKTICHCISNGVLVVGPEVTIESEATVTFKGKSIEVKPNFHAEPGSIVRMEQQ